MTKYHKLSDSINESWIDRCCDCGREGRRHDTPACMKPKREWLRKLYETLPTLDEAGRCPECSKAPVAA